MVVIQRPVAKRFAVKKPTARQIKGIKQVGPAQKVALRLNGRKLPPSENITATVNGVSPVYPPVVGQVRKPQNRHNAHPQPLHVGRAKPERKPPLALYPQHAA